MSDFQPIIFDDSFEAGLVDVGFGHQFGDSVLFKSGALLAMPTYEKSLPPDMLDLHGSAALENNPQSWAFTQPHFGPHLFYPTDFPGNGQDSDFQYVTGADFAHDDFDLQRPSVLDPRVRQAPEITSYTSEGVPGSTVKVHLQSWHDLHCPPAITLSLLFGSQRVKGMTHTLAGRSGHPRQYEVACTVPLFISTGWHSFHVPLRLVMESTDGQTPPQTVEVGDFTYLSQPSSAQQSRKRKVSSDSASDTLPPTKKTANPKLKIQDEVDLFEQNHASPYSPFLPTPTSGVVAANQQRTNSPRPCGHHYSTSTASQVSLAAPSPHTPAWSPSVTTVKTEPSPHPPLTPAPRPASTSVLKSAVPKLVRTSTIQSPGTGSQPVNGGPQSFNPYAMYPLKANLKLNGDLDAMTMGWAPEEKEIGRRLVEFSRVQDGNTINANFCPVAPEDANGINTMASCIYWKEKKEYFVTSVDTIAVLEFLVGVRFTVEEKNRIRRNLEGFRPMTVSKAKSDSEEFFKLIMSFPPPKPRNIEKDVKVFPWKILAHALKKIIGKYSASYSSTASAMPASYANAVYGERESAAAYVTDAPRDYVSAVPAAAYTTTQLSPNSMTSTTGYLNSIHASMPAVANELRLHMPPVAPEFSIPGGYNLQNMPPMTHPFHHISQVMSAPASTRLPTQWEFRNFDNEHPVTMAPASASVYPPGSIDTADFSTYSTTR